MPEAPPEAAGAPLSEEACRRALGVSRETIARLARYLDLLRRWQARINLVGASTLADPWRRHILDSGQLLAHVPPGAECLVDLGSGAGLPGLVLAILGLPEVHLIESDKRKAAFLREAARATAAPVVVHACRIAAAPRLEADVITARALAPLPLLLDHAAPFATPATICLFLKGRGLGAELTAARKTWTMHEERAASLSDTEGNVLILRQIQRAGSA